MLMNRVTASGQGSRYDGRGLVMAVPSAVLLVFMVSFFLPLSSKASNNIFYAGLAAPALIWWLRSLRDCLGPFRVSPFFFVFLFLLAAHLGIKDVFFLENFSYLVLMFLACTMLEQQKNAVVKTFLVFALVGVAMLLVGIIEWSIVILGANVAPRVILWGQSENPIFAALMIICGMVFIWVFHIEDYLAGRAGWIRWLGFGALVGMCIACAIIFQARSALIGLFIFFAAYVAQRRSYLKPALVAGALLYLVLEFSGIGDVLLERGVSFRPAIWEATVRRVVEDCGVVTGCGRDEHKLLGAFEHPHSAYLSVFYQGGLIGFALFAGMGAAFLASAWRMRSRWLLVALVGWGGVVTTTGGVFVQPRPLWVYLWIPTFMALLETGRPALEAYYRARNRPTRSG